MVDLSSYLPPTYTPQRQQSQVVVDPQQQYALWTQDWWNRYMQEQNSATAGSAAGPSLQDVINNAAGQYSSTTNSDPTQANTLTPDYANVISQGVANAQLPLSQQGQPGAPALSLQQSYAGAVNNLTPLQQNIENMFPGSVTLNPAASNSAAPTSPNGLAPDGAPMPAPYTPPAPLSSGGTSSGPMIGATDLTNGNSAPYQQFLNGGFGNPQPYVDAFGNYNIQQPSGAYEQAAAVQMLGQNGFNNLVNYQQAPAIAGHTPDFTQLNAEQAAQTALYAPSINQQQTLQNAYQNQLGGGFSGATIPDQQLTFAPASVGQNATSSSGSTDASLSSNLTPWATPGYNPGGLGGLGGYNPNPWNTSSPNSAQNANPWGGPFGAKNQFSLSS